MQSPSEVGTQQPLGIIRKIRQEIKFRRRDVHNEKKGDDDALQRRCAAQPEKTVHSKGMGT